MKSLTTERCLRPLTRTHNTDALSPKLSLQLPSHVSDSRRFHSRPRGAFEGWVRRKPIGVCAAPRGRSCCRINPFDDSAGYPPKARHPLKSSAASVFRCRVHGSNHGRGAVPSATQAIPKPKFIV